MSSRRLGSRCNGGEIVEVQGGHIVRSIARKDRHSKVYTSKGPRDRRVRLAAHTAIQFYDVQDRLGYDRPSRAVDWLIKKAQASIDELSTVSPAKEARKKFGENHQHQQYLSIRQTDFVDANQDLLQRNNGDPDLINMMMNSFLHPSMDADANPVGDSVEAISSAEQFQSFPTSDFVSRTISQSQFIETTPLPQDYDGPTFWSELEQQPTGISQFQRLPAWDTIAEGITIGNGGEERFLSNLPPTPHQQLLGETQFFSQRGPLQSSNTSSIRAWIDPEILPVNHRIPVTGVEFTSPGIGTFSGFQFPARILGVQEEHDGYCHIPSSASFESLH